VIRALLAGRRRLAAAVGLRWRLVAALVLTSGVTLAVAALTLLSPLESRLRQQELKTLVDTTVAFRAEFADLGGSDVLELTPRFRSIIGDLSRRTRGRVVVLNSAGQRLYDTDPVDANFPDAARALASRGTVTSLRQNSPGGGQAVAALPFRVAGGQRFVLVVRKALGDTAAAARTVNRAFLAAALAGLAIAVVLGFGLATTLLRRLRRLRQDALAVAAGGLRGEGDSPAASFDVSGVDEIGDLGRAFATMHDRLRREEHARRAFLATASHELRTPLAGLRGMLELLEEDLGEARPDIDDARRQLAKAQDQSRRLAVLATDLLDLSRLDAGIDLRSEPVELRELCLAVASEFEVRSAEGGVTVRPPPADGERWARADPGAIARVVRILLDNGLRHAPAGSAIQLLVDGDDSRAQIAVIDHGPGVADDEAELIFERFERGRQAGGAGGFGLGLAIGRELARAMQGDLVIASSARGARFELRLPAAPHRATEPEPSSAVGPAARPPVTAK
jgi:signal transduction histidine kinase